ncbi:MAG: hypothetical protein ACE5FT_01295 [Candidatus Nanoarchaeia archaeon]
MKRLALIMVLLLVLPAVSAVWDVSSDVEEVAEGDILLLPGSMLIRVHEVWEDGVAVSVEKSGSVIGSGEAEKGKPLIINEAVQVTFSGVSNFQQHGLVGRVQAFQWVDGRFVGHHFPRVLNLKTLYDVFATVENTGVKNAAFTVELTQAGEYLRRADRYMDEFGNLNARLIDAQRPFQVVDIAEGDTMRVKYEKISPLRRQPAGTEGIQRTGDVVFNLLLNDQIVDQILIPDVQLITGQSGYIEDVRMPEILVRDTPVEVEIDVVNAGAAYGGIERSKFNLYLNEEDFVFRPSFREFKTTELQVNPDLLRGDLPPFMGQVWKVRIQPFAKAGDYDLVFRLEHDGEVFDEFTVPVEVRPGALTRVEKIEVPERVNLGEEFPVKVKLANLGLGRDVTVKLEGSMVEEAQRHQLHMGPEEFKTVEFTVPATGQGRERLDVTVELERLEMQGKNFDPYTTTAYEIDTKSTSVYVYVPGMEETASEPVVTPAPIPKTREPIKVEYIPPPKVEPEATWQGFQSAPVFIVAAVLIILLIVIKVLFYYSGA